MVSVYQNGDIPDETKSSIRIDLEKYKKSWDLYKASNPDLGPQEVFFEIDVPGYEIPPLFSNVNSLDFNYRQLSESKYAPWYYWGIESSDVEDKIQVMSLARKLAEVNLTSGQITLDTQYSTWVVDSITTPAAKEDWRDLVVAMADAFVGASHIFDGKEETVDGKTYRLALPEIESLWVTWDNFSRWNPGGSYWTWPQPLFWMLAIGQNVDDPSDAMFFAVTRSATYQDTTPSTGNTFWNANGDIVTVPAPNKGYSMGSWNSVYEVPGISMGDVLTFIGVGTGKPATKRTLSQIVEFDNPYEALNELQELMRNVESLLSL
jgi:hypothetical protein